MEDFQVTFGRIRDAAGAVTERVRCRNVRRDQLWELSIDEFFEFIEERLSLYLADELPAPR